MSDETPWSADNCTWQPGPPRWTSQEAKARYDEIMKQAYAKVQDAHRKLDAELAPLYKEAAELQDKFSAPTVYPVRKP